MHRILPLSAALLLPVSIQAHETGPVDGHRSGRIECRNAAADEFGCQRVDLLAHLSLDSLAAGHAANDIWGWTDQTTGREYVLIGTFSGTVFVDISNPETPIRVGMLPAHDELRCSDRAGRHDDGCGEEGSAWRDLKVYSDHAFIVSEAFGHGMQVFDLRQLRGLGKRSQVFAESTWFDGFGDAHNIAVNEETGYAYAVGTDRFAGGPYFIDIRDPARPMAAGGYAGDGYTHDAQCVVYRGPDTEHAGAEICFLSNEDTVSVLDVSDKTRPLLLSRTGYSRASYTHQGWLDETQRWFYVNDELDEQQFGGRTSTYVWDMQDIDAPVLRTVHAGTSSSIDHNNYVRGKYLYQSNYTSGLRILDISVPDAPVEIAWFDSFPIDDHPSFNGTWSNYPFFASGIIALSDKEGGLFLLRQQTATGAETDLRVNLGPPGVPEDASTQFRYQVTVHNDADVSAEDVVVTHLLDPTTTSYSVSGLDDCRRRGVAVDCTVGVIDARGSVAVTFTQTVSSGGTKLAEVQATALSSDPDMRNNKATATVVVQSSNAPPPASAASGSSGGGGAFLWGSLVLLFARELRHRRALARGQ